MQYQLDNRGSIYEEDKIRVTDKLGLLLSSQY